MATKKGIVVKDSDFKDIDKLFEKATRDVVFTGTGYNPGKKKLPTNTTKKKVKRGK